uniref:Uncharacterized protein n=1 Tax=Fagus sylvatica TaxID=28930 RepID=A0A2N9GCV2_FAGSY
MSCPLFGAGIQERPPPLLPLTLARHQPYPFLLHGSNPALFSRTAPGGGGYGGFVVVMGLSGRRLQWPIWPWGGAAVGALEIYGFERKFWVCREFGFRAKWVCCDVVMGGGDVIRDGCGCIGDGGSWQV